MSETLDAVPQTDGPPVAAAAGPTPHARLALRTAGVALAVGALANALLRVGLLGVNFPIAVAALVAGALLLLRVRDGRLPREAIAAACAAVLFALGFAWRDSEMLAFLNLVAVCSSLALLAFAALRGPIANLRFGTVGEYLLAIVRSAGDAITGAVPLALRDIDLGDVSARLRAHRLQRVAVGLALAIPLLVVFGSLFAAADARFGALVAQWVRIDIGVVLSHVALTGAFAWLGGGWLRGVLLLRREPAIAGSPPFTLGLTEIGIALGLLDALFALFVGLQLRYLFGGDALVQAQPGLTYAEYARSGFFELCWASALVLPVLLGSRALLRVERPRDARVHQALSAVLVGLVGAVMVSAMARLRLYVAVYGWTEDRLFAIAAVGWLATVFAWYLATVLRGRDRGFAFGAAVSAALVLGQLNLIDPDAWVVRRNRELAIAGVRPLDPEFRPRSVSDDAIPDFLRSLPLLPASGRCRSAEQLLARWGDGHSIDRVGETAPPDDWRAWSVSRARARAAVQRARPMLVALHESPLCEPHRQPSLPARPAT